MEQWYVWLAVVILLTIVECTTINLTTIWFVISGILALILSFFVDSSLIQFGVFVMVGVVLLVATRPMLKNAKWQKKESTNLDRVVGMSALVTEKIIKNNLGEVKVDGKRWSAYSDEDIEVGSIVNVLEINGVKLKVERSGEN